MRRLDPEQVWGLTMVAFIFTAGVGCGIVLALLAVHFG